MLPIRSRSKRTPGCASAARIIIHDELQAHPEGLRGAEESFQRRVQVPTISRSSDRRAREFRPLGQVGEAQSHWFAHLAVFDHHGAELDGSRVRDQFPELTSVDPLDWAGAILPRPVADLRDGGLLFERRGWGDPRSPWAGGSGDRARTGA